MFFKLTKTSLSSYAKDFLPEIFSGVSYMVVPSETSARKNKLNIQLFTYSVLYSLFGYSAIQSFVKLIRLHTRVRIHMCVYVFVLFLRNY